MLGASVADLLVDRSVLLPLNEQVRRGERIESRRVVCRRKDGREVHVELTLSPVTDETGAVVGVSTIARDISERLRAEEELRRSEARYRDLFENAGDLIATADLSGRLTRANAAFCRALGYTEPELVGRAVAELVPEEWHAQLDDARAQKLERSSGTTVYEHELIGRGGERIPVEVSSRLIVAEGKPVEIEAVCRDLRERRRAERALRESEERYRMVVESTDALIAVLDDEYRLVYSSPAVERVLGYGREDLLGGRPFDLVHPSDTDSARAALAGRLAAGETALVRLRAHDGQWVPLETAVTQLAGPVAGGGTLLVVARDVSARISVEQALRESEERFRTLFEFSPRGMDLTDRTGTILDANEALARLLGYARDELIGRTFADFTHPEDVDADLDLYHELVNGERESYDLEKRYIRADGATITVHLTAFAIAADAGRPRRLIGIIDDITEQRVLEEQLRQSQKMEAIGRLAGGIAHDFNNLLTGINGFAELGLAALGEHDGGGPLERALAGIGQAADQAAALTRQLLAFSRRQVLEPQLVPINALARDFVPLLERLLGEHVAVELALDDDVGCVNADPAQLRQVLMNLAVNARDSMPDGGTLTIETEQVDLDGAPTMQGPLSGRFVLLAVSDTGTGMTADALERVFEPFYTTKDASSGTGLGLATVLGIVEQSGGRISVYSEPGVGSTFKVYLPSQDAGDEPAAPQKQEATPGSERLLLVEDNENVRSFTTAALESLGYGVTSCATPLEALRLVRDGIDADVVLSDLVMPELDGRELVAQLLVSRPSLGVVLMSGYTDDAIAARGVADENLIFLQKPFTVGQLGEAIRQALERRTARAAQKG
jgi:PAS domain S-box-containing protein